MADTKTGRPDMRRKENRYNTELVGIFQELEDAKQGFVQAVHERGFIDAELAKESYDTLSAQRQLPDMRTKPYRYDVTLVRALSKIMAAEEHIAKKAKEVQETKQTQIIHSKTENEETKPASKKKS